MEETKNYTRIHLVLKSFDSLKLAIKMGKDWTFLSRPLKAVNNMPKERRSDFLSQWFSQSSTYGFFNRYIVIMGEEIPKQDLKL
jgi:hypothetical protein